LSGPPPLTSNDVRARLDELYVQPHRKLIAFHGTGREDRIETRAGVFRIVPVKSELELRKLLPDPVTDEAPTAFLVPWTGTLPLDIGCAFAQDGLIFMLGRELRLKRMLPGVTEVEGDVRDSALAKHLLEQPPEPRLPFGGGRLTLDALWSAWLTTWAVPEEATLSLEALLAFASTSDGGPKFLAAVPSDVRTEWLSHLARRLGPAAPIVWSAWERGADRSAALELGLVFEALGNAGGEVRMWRLLKVRELGVKDAERERISVALATAAPGALRTLESRDPDGRRAPQLLAAADARADEAVVKTALIGSRYLPSAWTRRLDVLGEELVKAAAHPDAPALERVLTARRELERHRFSKQSDYTATLDRAEMANRLLAWLVAQSREEPQGGGSVYADVERLARWYAAEGGFVDWARRGARGGGGSAFGRGANAIVEAVDVVRTERDRTFARALPAWLAADRPETQVLGIESAVEHFVVRFLAAREERKVLVILMDGMAWTQAAEILLSLKTWGPLAWNFTSGARGSTTSVVPVIAALPTITDVSRAAFFAGKTMSPGRLDSTDKDVDRFAAFSKLRPFVPQGEVPRVMLRGEGHTTDGAASREALNLVRDERHRVVAIVINAIDSSLKADTQQQTSWTCDSIRPLRDLLEAAQETGRAVLLAADHGHVPCDRMKSVGSPPEAKSRWRVWKRPDEEIAEYEVAFEKTYAWAPSGAHGVVLLADDAHRYGAAPHAGEHGGATLAEVVAPAILIGTEQLVEGALPGEEDADLRVSRGFAAPSWWYPTATGVSVASESPSPPRVRRQTPKPMKAPLEQLALIQASAAPAHGLRAMLEASKSFGSLGLAADTKRRFLAAVDFLGRREGEQARLDAFADAMGILPVRAAGLVAHLSRSVNVDGYHVMTHDPVSDMVALDAATLKLLYGDG
jgi:hypothetical protein